MVLTQSKLSTDTAPGGSDQSDDELYWTKKVKQKAQEEMEEMVDELSESYHDNGDSDDEHEDDRDDLIQQVHEFANDASNININELDVPDETGTRTNDKKYQFCPPPHRLSILRLFAKHHSQHSMLPERHGKARSPQEIHCDAVTEMYFHCTRNQLTEVWVYMWNSWYSPNKWRLWARSAYGSAIPRKRTTMIVEALWKNLKGTTLHRNNRPRLDFVVHLIAVEAVPAYRVSFANVTGRLRSSRPLDLTSEQKSLKKAWLRLQSKPINGTYITDMAQWTCGCGAQKYNTHLLCKHLVQSVPIPPDEWWPHALRSHIAPFYHVPGTLHENTPRPEVSPYYWLPQMPRNIAEMPRTPQKQILGPSSRVYKFFSLLQLTLTFPF
jgi:hypothetical protein